MASANLEKIHTKVLQLSAMVSMLRVLAGSRTSELCPDTVGNYAWLMSDLLDAIEHELDESGNVTGGCNG